MKIVRAFTSLAVAIMLMLLPTASFGQGESSYVLGPEDVFVVTVVDQPKFSGEFIVPPTGVVNLPVAGATHVSGMSLEQLRTRLTEDLSKRLLRPEVMVVLKVARPQRFYVFGDVRSPGILDIKPGWTIAEGLSAAGGLPTGVPASDVMVTVEKAGSGKRSTLRLDEALNAENGDRITIEAGDILRFEAAQLTPIYISGQVKAPGLYKMRSSEAGVMEAITQAGGVLDDANIQNVRIIRLDGPEQSVDLTPVLLHGQSVKLPRLQAGDMVLIAQTQERFAILGHVTKPGYYTIPSGQKYTLSQAMALAQGQSQGARISRVGLVRQENGKEVRTVYDLGRFFDKADASMNPEIKPGDVIYVPENNTVDIKSILGFLSPAAILYRSLGR